MIALDALLRYSGVGVLVLMSALVWRDVPRSQTRRYLLLANAAVAAHLLGFTPPALAPPETLRMALRFIDVFQLLFIWLFALSLFQKDFRFRLFHGVCFIVYSAAMLMERGVQFGLIEALPGWWVVLVIAVNLALLAHMLAVTLGGRADDLNEARRRSRVGLVLILAVSAAVAIGLGLLLLATGATRHQPTANALSIWPALLAGALWLARAKDGALAFDARAMRSPGDARSAALAENLQSAMRDQRLYLDPLLTVESLAKHLGVGTHRLRGCINQRLGHENFSGYVNGLRIDAVKAALADPSNAQLPILTLALNHGFNSLPPFNRAFRKITGTTPSAYRKNPK